MSRKKNKQIIDAEAGTPLPPAENAGPIPDSPQYDPCHDRLPPPPQPAGRRVKSRALYAHPFCLGYWRDAAAELKDVKMLVVAAMMIAIRVALKLVAIPLAPNLKINTAFLANAVGAMIFGPVVAIPAAFVSDFLGVLITGDTYFLPFCLTEIGGSVLFALFLYRARISTFRVMLSRFSICLLINILLQTPLMMLYYQVVLGKTSYVLTVPTVLKNLFMFPVETVILTLFLSAIRPITYRFGLTYDDSPAMSLGKKQLIALALLFVVGAGCVFRYLVYYYDTTSLSASYTSGQRYDVNTKMTEILQTESDVFDGMTLVTTVESAYKKFPGSTITYNVAVYKVDEEALASYDKGLEDLRAMSKSKAQAAAADGVMEKLCDVVIKVDDSSGQVLDLNIPLA